MVPVVLKTTFSLIPTMRRGCKPTVLRLRMKPYWMSNQLAASILMPIGTVGKPKTIDDLPVFVEMAHHAIPICTLLAHLHDQPVFSST